MKLLDGKEVAAFHCRRMEEKLAELKRQAVRPELAIIVAGSDKPSAMYAASMEKKALAVGLVPIVRRLDDAVTEEEMLRLIEGLNGREEVRGILLMMPLPSHLDSRKIINAICPEKDVDGLTDCSAAALYTGRPSFIPCTPKAVMAVLDYYGIDLAGREVVVIGRSSVVGRPVAQLCLNRNATVTICHTGTKHLPAVTRRADVIIAAAGRPRLLTGDMVREGAVVIDVGINRVGGKTVGDVDFDSVAAVAGALTPVPGGIGAVTTTMVLENAVYGIGGSNS